MTDDAIFRPRDGSAFSPTSASVGPWDSGIVHGAAVAALFANQLAPSDGTLARLTVEFLAPVPVTLLHLERGALTGGSRVRRRDAALSADGRIVATARAVVVRRLELDLPDRARVQESPFDPAALPALDEVNPAAEELVGWPCFDSQSIVVEPMRPPGDLRSHLWISLAIPVVEGTEVQPVEIAAVAADYAQTAVNRQLSYASWSFRNAEMTVHLARDPVGPWIGVRCEGVVQPVGAGFNAADLYDRCGRMGRSAASLVVEQRD